jgi:hypothetical protein
VNETASTTLVAIRTDSGERLTISDASLDLLRQLSDAHLLICPHCSGVLMLKAGQVRMHHFAHVNLADCAAIDHEPESDSHRQGKMRLYQRFRHGARSAMLERHLPATDQRADVFIEMPDGQGYALEFQQANNTVERWNERHRLYRSQQVADIWFLGQIRYLERRSEGMHPISPYDPLPVPRNDFNAASGSFQARELEKAIAAVEPMLYYLDPDTGDLTVLLKRDLQGNTLRAYRYQIHLDSCELRDGKLWTPLDPLLDDYRRYLAERAK